MRTKDSCSSCGRAVYRVAKSRADIVCHDCRRLKRLPRPCAGCGETFEPKKPAGRYCSRRCASVAQSAALEYRAEGSRSLRVRAAGGLSEVELAEILHAWQAEGRPCEYCGGACESVDHVVPLVRGGANVLSNLAPACIACNSSKGVKLLEEWGGPSHARAA